MTWYQAVPTALAAMAILVLPGYVVVRSAGAPGCLALGAAPAVSAGVIGSATVVYGVLGIRWTLISAALALAVVAALVALAGGGALLRGRRGQPALAWRLAVAGAVGLAFLVQGMPLKSGMVEPAAILQAWDAPFHLNGVEVVRQGGDASPVGGLSALYADPAATVFYPSTWHAIVAVLPGSAPVAANVMLFVALAIWLMGIAALAWVAWPGNALVAVLAPLVAASSTAYPAVTVRMSQYPLTLAVALIPGALALVAWSLTLVPDRGSQRHQRWLCVVAVLLALAGAGLVHTSAAVAVAVAGLPLVGLWGLERARAAWSSGRRWTVVAWGAATLLAGVVVAGGVLSSSTLREMSAFSRPELAPGDVLAGVLRQHSGGPSPPHLNLVVSAAVVVGALVALTRTRSRWLSLAWLSFVGLCVVAYLPPGRIKIVSSFWFNEAARIQAIVDTLGAPLGAIGLCTVGAVIGAGTRVVTSRKDHRAQQVLAAASAAGLLAAGFFLSDGFRREEKQHFWIEPYFAPARYASAGEIAMLRSLGDILDEDALVLGDPFNGAPLILAITGRHVAIPQLGDNARSAGEQYLLDHFSELRTDPQVCQIIRREGITHFYADEPMTIYGWDLAATFPGMYGVDTSSGFELEAAGGTARLYRITACA